MQNKRTQRFIQNNHSNHNYKNYEKAKLPITYILTGIIVLLLSLIPIAGSLLLILWGMQVMKTSLIGALLLIIVGSVMGLTILTGMVIYAIKYFTNDAEKKLREIQYKDSMKMEDIFIKCQNCGATLLVDADMCTKCGAMIEKEEEGEEESSSKIEKIKKYFKDTYNVEIDENNIDIINGYFTSKFKIFEYTHTSTKKDKDDNVKINYRESMLSKFLYNFRKIIVVCSLIIVVVLLAFYVLAKSVVF